MKYNKSGFSLVEIMIATVILTIWLFGIYKLIWNNMAIVWNNWTLNTQKMMSYNFEQCLSSLWYDRFKELDEWVSFSMNFWDIDDDYKKCIVGDYNNTLDFTPVVVDGTEYYLYGTRINDKTSESIEIKYSVYVDRFGDLNHWNNTYTIVK